jgi:hypothetical protein
MTSIFPPWSNGIFYAPGAFVSYLNISYQSTALQPNVLQYPDISPSYWTVYGAPTNSVSSINAGQGVTVTDGQTSSPTIAANLVATGAGIGLVNGTGTAINISNTGVTSAIAGTGVSVSSATGAVTIGNTGVTSVIAGTNVTVSSATGAVTISSTASGGFTPTTQVLVATRDFLTGQTATMPNPVGEGLYCILGCSTSTISQLTEYGQFSVMVYVNSSGNTQMGGSGLAAGNGNNTQPVIVPVEGSNTLFFQNNMPNALSQFSIVAIKLYGPISGCF